MCFIRVLILGIGCFLVMHITENLSCQAQSFIYSFDQSPHGKNTGLNSGSNLEFVNHPLSLLSPFDSNADDDISNEFGIWIQRSLGQYGYAMVQNTSGFTGSYTIEAFIRPESVPAGSLAADRHGIVQLNDAEGQLTGFYLTRVQGTARLGAVIRRRAGGFASLTGQSALESGRWYHVMLRVTDPGAEDATVDSARLYVNGNLDATVTGQAFVFMPRMTNLYVGTVAGSSRCFDGAMDQIRILNGVDHATWLEQIPNALLVLRRTPNLRISRPAGHFQIRLDYEAADNGRFVVLSSEGHLSAEMEFSPVGELFLQDASLNGFWIDSDDPEEFAGSSGENSERPLLSEVNERYYKIAYEPMAFPIVGTVKDILEDGQGDFDPWNQQRWVDWYAGGVLVKPFILNTSVRFATRETAWTPNLSGLSVDYLFLVSDTQCQEIDGNGLVLDARKAGYRTRTLDQLYEAGQAEWKKTEGLMNGFRFSQPRDASQSPTRIHGLTLKGFRQGIRTWRNQNHPLMIEDCIFTRNEWGTYFSGSHTHVIRNQYLENCLGGFYAGHGSNHLVIEENLFRDNNYAQLHFYSDMILDTAYGCEVFNNMLLPSQVTFSPFRIGITLYRNLDDRITGPFNNHIYQNTMEGYSTGFHIGSRMGRDIHYDVSKEARDHVHTNIFENNILRNTTIGFKITASGNLYQKNTFENVEKPFVLHCVFYNLIENVINDQSGASVSFWWSALDYPAYSQWFPLPHVLSSAIPVSEKVIHAHSDRGAPSYPSSAVGTFIQAPTLLKGSDFLQTHSTGGKPIDFAVGDFVGLNPGPEIAVIWDQPVSNIQGENYYTMIIYDSRGIELGRSGRSKMRWGMLTAGNFLRTKSGYFDPEDEIAAVYSEPVDGRYPVYVFRRGFAEPEVTLLQNNTEPVQSLAAGNFKTDGDVLDEIALVLKSGSQDIIYVKPSEPQWLALTTSIPVRLSRIAAGNFDGNAGNGDEVAGISTTADPTSSDYPIYFFRPRGTGSFAQAASGASSPWAAIGAGAFEGTEVRDSVVVSSSAVNEGIHPLEYYLPGSGVPFKTDWQDVLVAPVLSLGAGRLPVGEDLTDYERVQGLSGPDYGAQIAGWGDHAVVLSSLSQLAYWMTVNPEQETQRHLRATPLLR